MPRAPILTLPNVLSSSRVVLAFAFFATTAVPARLALIFAASATDFFDGWLARRSKVPSRFGALIDPVADRFFVLCVLVAYVMGSQLSVWQAVAIMFRDVMSVIGFFVARNVSWLRAIPFMARPIGKVVTGLQLIIFLAVLLRPTWVNALVIVCAVLGVIATVDYTLMLWRERTPKSLRV